MHIAINPTNIIKEKTKGGRCKRRIEKSATNKLVKKGWSTKALSIFLMIALMSISRLLLIKSATLVGLMKLQPMFVKIV